MHQRLFGLHSVLLFVLSTLRPAGAQDTSESEGLSGIRITSCDNDVPAAVAGGGVARLCCLTPPDSPTGPPTWFRNSNELHMLMKDQMTAIDDMLLLFNPSKSQAGSYHCCVREQCSPPITLTVIDPPTVALTTDGVMEGGVGSEMTLLARVTADKSNVRWHASWYKYEYKLGCPDPGADLDPDLVQETILNFTRQSGLTVPLRLTDLGYDQQGRYRLFVSNSYYSKWSRCVKVVVTGPPETPSITALDITTGSGPRLRIRWFTPPPPEEREHNDRANVLELIACHMEGSTRRCGKFGLESIPEGEYVLDYLEPCTKYELQLRACNSRGCSESNMADERTGSDSSSRWLFNNLYKKNDAGKTLLFREGIDARELCVPRTLNFLSFLGLCDHELPLLSSQSTGVFRVDFSCPFNDSDPLQCSYTCPVPALRCKQLEQIVFVRKLCQLSPSPSPSPSPPLEELTRKGDDGDVSSATLPESNYRRTILIGFTLLVRFIV